MRTANEKKRLTNFIVEKSLAHFSGTVPLKGTNRIDPEIRNQPPQNNEISNTEKGLTNFFRENKFGNSITRGMLYHLSYAVLKKDHCQNICDEYDITNMDTTVPLIFNPTSASPHFVPMDVKATYTTFFLSTSQNEQKKYKLIDTLQLRY